MINILYIAYVVAVIVEKAEIILNGYLVFIKNPRVKIKRG